MLSPANHHLSLGKSLAENMRDRHRYLAAAAADPSLQGALLKACQQDILFWINLFVWQYNPNAIGEASEEVGPFITWDFQDEAVRTILDCLEKRNDLVIEKSREMGASWLCLLVMDWFYLFHPWKKFLMISRNAETVDKPGDSDSLFWKLDFVHEHLPPWMTEGRGTRPPHRRGMSFVNPLTRSSITGQATTGSAGVGGRAWGMFIDEFSLIREDSEVLQHTANTTGCRIFNGTQRGTGTKFYELTQRVDYRKLQMHWTQHPDKRKGLYRWDAQSNRVEVLDKGYHYPPEFQFVHSESPAGGPFPGLRSPYYDDQVRAQGSPRAVAMNLDMDAGGSVSEFFDALKMRAYLGEYGRPPVWEGELSYDVDAGQPHRGLMHSPGGGIKLWLHLKPDGTPPKGRYVAGADLSYGTGATPSVVSMADARTGVKVLEYATVTKAPEEMAPFVAALCWLFQDDYGQPAWLAWETPGPGIQFGKRIVNLGFNHIYYRESHESLDGGRQSDIPGWYAQPKTKELLLSEYRAALYFKVFINHSEEALKECRHYRYAATGKGVEHPTDLGADDPTKARQNHGDRVIADALCWMLCQKLDMMDQRPEKQPEGPPVGSLAFRRQHRHEMEREEEMA